MSTSSIASIPRARSTSSIVSFNDPEFDSKVIRSFCDNDKDTIMKLWCRAPGPVRQRIVSLKENETKRTPLHYCAEKGFSELTKFLTETGGADINALDDLGWTPLHAACSAGHTSIVYYLLISGAKVTYVTSSGCIALNYFVRHCGERSKLLVGSCLGLLTPSPSHLLILNERGESLLHYACLNNSDTMPFIVSYLMENGVDPGIRNKRNALCWAFLSDAKKEKLSKFVDANLLDVKKENAVMSSYIQDNSDGTEKKKKPTRLEIEYAVQDEHKEFKLLRELLIARLNLKLAIESNDKNQYLKTSLEAIERSIDQQRPEGVTASLKRLLESGQEYCDTMLEEYGVQLNNQTARELIHEGKAMICKNFEPKIYQHIYYILYNDCLILFDDCHPEQRNDEVHELLTLIPLTHLHCYYIPEYHGIPKAVQIVHQPLYENARKTFTILFQEAEGKGEFITTLYSCINNITETHIIAPVNEIPPADTILKQGFLVNKGVVVSFFMKVYVRLTASHLFYYENDTTYTTLGKISLADTIFRYDAKKKLLKWSLKNGRSFSFFALTTKDYNEWIQAKFDTMVERTSNPTLLEKAKVDVTILAGRNLAPKDSNGKSDPYCVVSLCDPDGNFVKRAPRFKTPVQYKTLMPNWEENNTFSFNPVIKGELLGIRIDVWDEDKYSSDDFMGKVVLDPKKYFKEQEEVSMWIPVQSREGKNDIVSGDIYVRIFTFGDDWEVIEEES